MSASFSEEEYALIQQIEEHNFQSVPSLETIELDGWIIRLSDGRTKRSNSVNFLTPGTQDPSEKITECEGYFLNAGISACFRKTPLMHPNTCSKILISKGYKEFGHTDAMICDLSLDRPLPDNRVVLEDRLSDTWLDAHAKIKNLSDAQKTGLKNTLQAVDLPMIYASLHVDGTIAAIGQGVVSSDLVGLFDFMTDPAFKRRGYASIVANSILYTAQKTGVSKAYLQVEQSNISGKKFWASVGFNKKLYSYSYLTKTGT